jgi:peroxiredoxin
VVKYIFTLLIFFTFWAVSASGYTLPQDTLPIQTVRTYIIAHPNDARSLRLLKGLSFTRDYSTIEPLYQLLGAALKRSTAGLKFGHQLEGMKHIVIGQTAPDFAAPDTTGNLLTLSQFRGSYVLLDFWASWCVPCRQQNPELLKMYNKFCGKRLVVVSISLDKNRAVWLNAIKADRITSWYQVSDLRYWDSQIAKLYGIQAIPQSFLIDPNGKLIAKNVRGNALEAKLTNLLLKANE